MGQEFPRLVEEVPMDRVPELTQLNRDGWKIQHTLSSNQYGTRVPIAGGRGPYGQSSKLEDPTEWRRWLEIPTQFT